MKKLVTSLLSVALAVCLAFGAAGCDLYSGSPFNISFTVDGKEYTYTVIQGETFALTKLPEKYGYVFDGLYDAETDGNLFVDAEGKSVGEYKEGKSKTLYARWKPQTYTIELDYGGALATDGGSLSAEYDGVLPALPSGLTLEGKTFVGWYTQADCGGFKVSDADGATQALVNKNNFNLDEGKIKLFAGFEITKYTVTFRGQTGSVIKTAEVLYGSTLADAANSVRVNGMAVLTWDKELTTKVTADTELNAVELAPYIEFDCKGGSGASTIIARVDSLISLPTPEKENNNFLYWADESGAEYTATTMPAKSVKLKAVWQPKVVFDSNGGNEVNDITDKKAGETITLPAPTREGYVFAGWYTKNGEKFTKTTMPADGVALKAGWCATKEKTFDFSDKTSSYYVNNESGLFFKLSFSDLNPDGIKTEIKVSAKFSCKHYGSSNVSDRFGNLLVGCCSQQTFQQSFFLGAIKQYNHDSVKDYRKYTFEQAVTAPDNFIHVMFRSDDKWDAVYIANLIITIECPDYTNVIL